MSATIRYICLDIISKGKKRPIYKIPLTEHEQIIASLEKKNVENDVSNCHDYNFERAIFQFVHDITCDITLFII